MTKRIAVIADTHLPRGTRQVPERCIEAIRTADAVIHVGDFVTEDALAQIEAVGPRLWAVHGNVDEPALRQRLPAELELEVGGLRIALIHDAGPASGRAERLRARFPAVGCVVFGHTHRPEHARAGDLDLFNPGSPTERRRAPHRAMGMIEVAHGAARFSHIRL